MLNNSISYSGFNLNNLGFSFTNEQRSAYNQLNASDFTPPTREMIDRATAAYLNSQNSQREQNNENWHGNVINTTAGNLPPQTVEEQGSMITNLGMGTGFGLLTGGAPGAFAGFWSAAWGTAADHSFGITPAITNAIRETEQNSQYDIRPGGGDHEGGGADSYDFGGWGSSHSVNDNDSWF